MRSFYLWQQAKLRAKGVIILNRFTSDLSLVRAHSCESFLGTMVQAYDVRVGTIQASERASVQGSVRESSVRAQARASVQVSVQASVLDTDHLSSFDKTL